MAPKLDITADVGESYSVYRFGNDEKIIPLLGSCNIACGWHAGSPDVIRATVKFAKKHGVQIGSHQSFQDRDGFGRRYITMSSDEIRNILAYQFGALEAFAKIEGMKIQHVIPHGALGLMSYTHEEYADAIVDSILELDSNLIAIASDKTIMYSKAKKAGLRVARIFLPEMNYAPDGSLAVIRSYGPKDPNAIADKVIKMIKTHKVITIDGSEIEIHADFVNLHGDNPNAPEVISTVRKRCEEEGIEIVPMGRIV